MNLQKLIRMEQAKTEQELARLKNKAHVLRAVAKELSGSYRRVTTEPKQRHLSDAGRERIAAAARRRWAKHRKHGMSVVKHRAA